MEKKEARRIVREAIERMTWTERAAAADAICRRLLDLPEVRKAQTIMAYLPLPDELDTRPFLRAIFTSGRRLYVPHTDVRGKRMWPLRLTALDDLRTGDYGIREPRTVETCRPEEIDLVLVPGRAFDRQGNRLGRGGGFYDRFMGSPGFRAVRCAAAFACQVLDEVPHAPHDLPVEILVTERETLRFGRRDVG